MLVKLPEKHLNQYHFLNKVTAVGLKTLIKVHCFSKKAVLSMFAKLLNMCLKSRFHYIRLLGFAFYKSSRPDVFCEKCVLRNFAPATLLKKKLWHKCFPVNFAKFLRTPCSQNTSARLLLHFLLRRSQDLICLDTILLFQYLFK